MFKNILLLIAFYWLASCNNTDHSTVAKIDDQLAEKIVRDYIEYKNTGLDGAGTTKAEKIVILEKKQIQDTVWIKYSWSGQSREALTPYKQDTTFSKVTGLVDEAKAIKKDSLWLVH
jgi:hypothetical protein